jgi:hypothetical protein
MVTTMELLPHEELALKVATERYQRGDEQTPNIALTCILALARLKGEYNWINGSGYVPSGVAKDT